MVLLHLFLQVNRDVVLSRSKEHSQSREHTFLHATAVYDLLAITLSRRVQYNMLADVRNRHAVSVLISSCFECPFLKKRVPLVFRTVRLILHYHLQSAVQQADTTFSYSILSCPSLLISSGESRTSCDTNLAMYSAYRRR